MSFRRTQPMRMLRRVREKHTVGERLRIECVSAAEWCRRIRVAALQRPWDLLFPPERLYAEGSTFEVGSDIVHSLVLLDNRVVACYVIAMRHRVSCLMDVRCVDGADPAWSDAMLEHWESIARTTAAETMMGPVGAFSFLTDGVADGSQGEVNSIHIPVYPHTIVDSFSRRGYVHAWSGAVWGRKGDISTAHFNRDLRLPGVRRGSWMNIASSVRNIEGVLSASFTSLPWHRGRGAGIADLVRSYVPVFAPSLGLQGMFEGRTVGAVLMYRDVASIPRFVYTLPRNLQRLWLLWASRRSNVLHVSVIGLLPKSRNSRIAKALFEKTLAILAGTSGVTTSCVRQENRASQLMCARAGLHPLQHRIVFTKVLSTIFNNSGERE